MLPRNKRPFFLRFSSEIFFMKVLSKVAPDSLKLISLRLSTRRYSERWKQALKISNGSTLQWLGSFFMQAQPRGGIFRLLWSPGIGSEKSIPPAFLAWRAGTTQSEFCDTKPYKSSLLAFNRVCKLEIQPVMFVLSAPLVKYCRPNHLTGSPPSSPHFPVCE